MVLLAIVSNSSDWTEKGRHEAGRRTQGKSGAGYEVFASIGVETIRTPVRSPRANAFAERFVRTVRNECLDHLLIVSQRHLESVLDAYVRHYNEARPHRGLQLTQPIPRPLTAPDVGAITRRYILGGIVHEYDRAA